MKTKLKLKRNRVFPRFVACPLAALAFAFAGGVHPVCAQAVRAARDGGNLTISATAAAPAAGAPAQPPEQQQAAQSDVLAALQKLAMSIRDKIDAEKKEPVAQDYALELAGFDAIIASNKGAPPDDLAQVLAVKAGLYVQAFNDFDNAAKTITRIRRDYPQTEIAAHADEMLADLKRMQAKYLAQQTLAPGRVFPHFIAKSLDGRDVSLAYHQLRGEVVLVDFWATWCPPCVAELPRLKALYAKYHERGFEIVSISLDQSESALRDFIRKNSIPWTQIFDGKGWESPLAAKYGVDMIPTMYLLNADGKIIGSNLGGLALEEQLEKLLGK